MELFVVLVCNPDGYEYTHTTDRFWRRNRRNDDASPTGVDLNRNFSFQWADTGVAGHAPFSEGETIALNDLVLSRGTSLVGLLNYHTYGTRVMHNWAYTYELPPNVDFMGPLAREMAFAIEAENGQRMRNGSWAVTLNYTGGGATNDYVHAELGVPTFTLELRPGDGASGGFAPTGASIAPSQSENIPGAVLFLRRVRTLALDSTPPSLSDLRWQISNTRATFRWSTDDAATRSVEYGPTVAYDSERVPDRLRGKIHSVTPHRSYAGNRLPRPSVLGESGGFGVLLDRLLFLPPRVRHKISPRRVIRRFSA